jgi:protein SCO1
MNPSGYALKSPVSPARYGAPARTFGLVWARARAAIWRRRFALAATGLSALVLGATLTFANWYLARDERLGVVNFPISCGWQSQRDFTTATALLHLFQFADAQDVYKSVVERDPACAIAYWGIAMSRLQNPLYALPSSEDESIAQRALAAAAMARNAIPRERAYLAAVGTLFDADQPDWQARKAAYVRAMAQLVADYPRDREAVIFYALALNLAGESAGKTKAAELLLLAFSEEPQHPGIEHYLTYCLGPAAYQPRPFERTAAATTAQRMLLAAFSFVALCALGLFVTFTADLRPGAGSAGRIGGPFVLTAPDGTTVTDRSFRGRWLLICFGCTRSPNVCPATLSLIAELLDKLGPLAGSVQPLFITVDPAHDTPEILGEFTRTFHPGIIGLTGKPAEIAAVAQQYRVFSKSTLGGDVGIHSMEHGSYLYLMDPGGRHFAAFSHEKARASDEIVVRLRELLSSSQPGTNSDFAGIARLAGFLGTGRNATSGSGISR